MSDGEYENPDDEEYEVVDAEIDDDGEDDDEPESADERTHRMPIREIGEDGYELPDPDDRRCNAKISGSLDEDGTNGIRCRRWKLRGGRRCRRHGGARNPALNAKRVAEQEWERMRSRRDEYWYPDVSWEKALQMELNRTQWEIVRLEQKIRAVQSSYDPSEPLGGKAEMAVVVEEDRSGGPGGGYTLERKEAMESTYVKAWREERRHLANIVKTAATAGLGREYIDTLKSYARATAEMALDLAANLGLDTDDQKVQSIISMSLLTLDDRVAAISGSGSGR